MDYIDTLIKCLRQMDTGRIDEIAHALRACQGTVYVLGNGGSQANASHLVLHLLECGVRARDVMGETAWLTASANDHSYEASAARLLVLTGREGDALLVLSGSGNSPNVVLALTEAKGRGMMTLGFLGFGGGAARGLCDCALVLTSKEYGPVEDSHSAAIHILAGLLHQQNKGGGK